MLIGLNGEEKKKFLEQVQQKKSIPRKGMGGGGESGRETGRIDGRRMKMREEKGEKCERE